MLHLVAAAKNCPSGQICLNALPHVNGSQNQIQEILQILFGVIGALAFLFMVIAGLRFVISSGDPQDTARAREAIIYSLVGLALAMSAEIIVTWVVGQL